LQPGYNKLGACDSVCVLKGFADESLFDRSGEVCVLRSPTSFSPSLFGRKRSLGFAPALDVEILVHISARLKRLCIKNGFLSFTLGRTLARTVISLLLIVDTIPSAG
jgi:hypothetical protein